MDTGNGLPRKTIPTFIPKGLGQRGATGSRIKPKKTAESNLTESEEDLENEIMAQLQDNP